MTQDEFKSQMDRLIETYGKSVYNPERLKLVWEACQYLPQPWLKYQVDTWIGSLRTAPLVPEFREAISEAKYKNKIPEAYADDSSSSSWENHVSKYCDDERKMMMDTILKRVNHRLSDAEWENFQELIK